jgi:hypothetical protein
MMGTEGLVGHPRHEAALHPDGITWQRGRHRRAAAVACCRQFVAFLFSQIGLASSVVAYSIFGGVIFSAIESPHEADVRLLMEQNLNASRQVAVQDLVSAIRNLTDNLTATTTTMCNGQNCTSIEVSVERVLLAFQNRLAQAVREEGWDGHSSDAEMWSFTAALLYAVTIITTIGRQNSIQRGITPTPRYLVALQFVR